MSGLLPTPSPVVRVRLIHGIGLDVTAGSRFFMKYTDAGAPSIADLNTMATFVRTTWAAQLVGLCSANAALESVIIDDLAATTGNQGVDTTAVSGSRAGAIVEQDQAVQINFKVGQRYRGGKFKCYLPFGVQADTAGTQLWSGAFANAVTSGWNAFITALNGHTAGSLTLNEQQAVSYFKGPTAPAHPKTWGPRNVPNPRGTPVVYDVISVNTSRVMTNLRRRQGR